MTTPLSPTGPRLRRALVLLGIAALVAVWLEFLIVRHRDIFGAVGALLAVVTAVIVLKHSRRGPWLLLGGLAGVTAVLQLLMIATSLYSLWIAAFVATLALVFAAFVAVWATRPRGPVAGGARVRRGILRGVGTLGVVVASVLSIAFASVAITPVPMAVAVQESGGSGNSFEPAAATQTKVVNGTQLTNDIQYGTTYPNSYLDVYIADNDPTVSRPTFVVVHGGGFISGSKTDGDPNADDESVGAYFALASGPVLDAGYNVVTVNYGLAPQVPYPTPVLQLGEALQFLEKNGAAYGLDMSRVVLSGGSAGGHIVAQYAAIQTNPAYAEQMGIAPTTDPQKLKAMVLDSAAFVPEKAGRTQAAALLNDFLFDLSVRAYLGTSPDRLAEGNIVTHATAAFPPSFIADGNTGSFPDQATEFSQQLTNVGVKNELDIPPVSDAVLGHGYMVAASPWTDAYNQKKIAFLTDVVG